MAQPFKLLGFAPDADPTTPGVLPDVTNMIPTVRGMRTMHALAVATGQSSGSPAALVVSADELRFGDSATRVLAGTLSKLYEYHPGTGAWSDVSAGGGTYSSVALWTFAAIGTYVLAASSSGAHSLQAKNGAAGSFAAISGAPNAKIVRTVARFAMTLGDNVDSDRWKCSARDDHTDWTLDVTTQCATGRLVDDDGPLVAGEALGSDFLAFKSRSIYFGSYVGAPEVWNWRRLPFDDGCRGPAAVCRVRDTVAFLGSRNLYLMSGQMPVPLMDGKVREYYLANTLDVAGPLGESRVVFDERRNVLLVQMVSAGAQTLVYSLDSGLWGKLSTGADSALFSSTPTGYYGELRVFSIFDSSTFKLKRASTSGVMGSPSMVTWDFGDTESEVELKGARVNWITSPSSPAATAYSRPALGESLTTGSTVTRSADNKYELRQSARWHRLSFSAPTEGEAISVFLDVSGGGNRK